MANLTLAVLVATPRSLLSQGNVPRPRAISLNSHLQLGVFFCIVEYERHKLLNAHGFTFVTPRHRGWEVFSMSRALTHIKIGWSLSPMAPQLPGIALGPPCAHRVARHSL
jgi:hypothetical protein